MGRPGALQVGRSDVEGLRAARGHYEQLYRVAGGVATRSRVLGFLAREEGGTRVQWKNLGEHTVYQNPWLTVNLADVELPDGRHLDHYLIRQRPVALATVVNERNEVLLLWRHRFITDSWGWELAAGVVEDGEPLIEAAEREMLKEAGWRPIGPLRHLLTVEPSNGLSDARHDVYWAEGAEHVGHPVDDFESSRREWVPLKDVPDLIARGEVRSANTVAALLMLHHLRLG
jgi:8-oxo-dGTP pyrophosphatase MutT (NUDIX family)